MITFAICDDDIQYMEHVPDIIIDEYKKETSLDEECRCILFQSGKELVEKAREENIDVFFVDIECGEMLGFDIARELLKDRKDLGIVYITNHDHYVYNAFVCRPLGFIRKNAIDADIKIAMMNIVEYLEDKKRKITFESKNDSLSLYVSEIVVVEVFLHRLQITTIDRILEFNGTLSKYETLLESYGFIKISRSIWVNKKYITKVEGDQIYLCNRIIYTISRRKVKEVKRNLFGIGG